VGPAPGGFGAPPPAPGGFGPPPAPPAAAPPAHHGFGAPPPQPQHAPAPPRQAPQAESSGQDLQHYTDGLRAIALELRGIAASKSILSTQILPSPLPGVAALGIRYGRSMHVICAGGQFGTPIWPSRDFSDRDKLLAATIGNNAPPEQMIPWVLTYVLPGVFPDLGKDEQSKAAFVEAADAFGVGVDQAGIDAARRQGFPEVTRNHARFLVVSEPKQSIAGIELRWGDRPFEMLYVPTPGVVARSAPWT